MDRQAPLLPGSEAGRTHAFAAALTRHGPTGAVIVSFRELVLGFYRVHGRRMPWRETTDPYRILVSEVMLQQTRVERVLPRYVTFIDAFPTVVALADAPVSRVLAAWQGLGYNRRALALRAAAARIVTVYGGRIPDDPSELVTLPGVGPATAAAVAVYAFNRPEVFIETNVRRVFLHCFFPGRDRVRDAELLPLVRMALDRDRPREWYWALMDYGTHLARTMPNPNWRSAHHAVQGRFEGSRRQLRGRVLAALLSAGPLTLDELAASTGAGPDRTGPVLAGLVVEGFIAEDGPFYRIRDGPATDQLK
ncbi:MAG TPA: A/G-specific adenine glycosylase [Methanoregulaceae archaeon]|nr:A/G-specific adenine glycosylase [Methanoregulaceae archaeon]